ncbi:MAG: hypothetical protein ABJN74_04585 [Gilvibacter sp.]
MAILGARHWIYRDRRAPHGCHGLIAYIPTGGQTPPILKTGEIEEAKKNQKKAKKKNMIADTIKSAIYIFVFN